MKNSAAHDAATGRCCIRRPAPPSDAYVRIIATSTPRSDGLDRAVDQ